MKYSDIAGQAIANLLNKQGDLPRRKDSVLLILTGILWAAPTLTAMAADWPTWIALLIGTIASVAAATYTALTKGAFTPSMKQRVVEEAEKIERELEEKAAPVIEIAEDVRDQLSDGVSQMRQAAQDAVERAEDYIGQHRLHEETEQTGIGAYYTNG